MAICPFCKANLDDKNDLDIKSVTSFTEIKMISCKKCKKVIGFTEK